MKYLNIKQSEYVHKIKDEPLRLFFQSPIIVRINEMLMDTHLIDMDEFVSKLKWLQANANVESIGLVLSNDNKVNVKDFKDLLNVRELMMLNEDVSLNASNVGGVPSLEFLKLNTNLTSKRKIQNLAFSSLKKLETLKLSRNQLYTINSFAFYGLVNLKELDLSHNCFKSINDLMFKDLSNLLDLDISHNRITRIDSNAFAHLRSLKLLNMHSIHIDSIDEHLFSSLGQLEGLRIASSTLVDIHPKAFAALENLNLLYLEAEQLEKLPPELFENMTGLKRLFFCRVKCFTFDAIKCLSNLEFLNLTQTNVTEIKVNDLDAFVSLKNLILQMNKIQSLDSKIFQGLPNLGMY